jgi:5'-3' exonuclease
MGIPSYFSYIVKNHTNIIKKLNKNTLKVNNLYMDCNSIIYDAVYNIDFSKLLENDVKTIISNVIKKIDEYICLIEPDTFIFIAFDGVAPVAKMEQQRQRRYKSMYLKEISKTIFKNSKPDTWNTTAITPGTSFMNQLNTEIKTYYKDPSKYNVKNIILSTSDFHGEGEHKLFDFIRNHTKEHLELTTIVYGLDADLIMLCINHLPICKKIYLFRETPEFIKSINIELEPNEKYILDIPELTSVITNDMCDNQFKNDNRIYDYIFLCFFLGNDFMPHFPAINIRTGGIDKLLTAYKSTIGNTNQTLIDGKTINWKNLRKLIQYISISEEELIQKEFKLRDRREKMFFPVDTPENVLKKIDNLPSFERELEKYINPLKEDWERRYYKILFNIEIDDTRRKQICINYLEGLEWVFKYYNNGCCDWRWSYKYNYPPLLCDLIKYIPYYETSFFEKKESYPVSELLQLSYVLPIDSLSFLPSKIQNGLIEQFPHLYKNDYNFIWCFCKYFWESHAELPEIDIFELEKFILTLMN